MSLADLFTFDNNNLLTPRELPEGWRAEATDEPPDAVECEACW